MKTFFTYTFVMALMVMGLTATAAEPRATITFNNPDHVLVTATPAGSHVEVTGIDGVADSTFTISQDYDSDVVVSSSKRRLWSDGRIANASAADSKFNVIVGGLLLGGNVALGKPAEMDALWNNSMEISILNLLGAEYSFGKNSFSAGFGLGWREYKMRTPVRFIPDNGGLTIGSYPANAIDPEFSRIKTFGLSVNFLWHQHLKGKWDLSFGPVLNAVVHGSVKTRWTGLDGSKVTQGSTNIGQHKFTVDGYASISYNKVLGLYLRWSPMKVLKNPSPQFSNLSFGVVIGM